MALPEPNGGTLALSGLDSRAGADSGEGVFIGLDSGVEVNSRLGSGTGAISGLQDIPYSNSIPGAHVRQP